MASCSSSVHLIGPCSHKPKSLFWRRQFSRESTQRLADQAVLAAARLGNRKHRRLMWLRCDQAWPWQITGLCKYCVRLLSQRGSPAHPRPRSTLWEAEPSPIGAEHLVLSLSSLPNLFPDSVSFLRMLHTRKSHWSDWFSVLGKGWNIISLWKMFLLYLQVQR